jgi:hypothetical protein
MDVASFAVHPTFAGAGWIAADVVSFGDPTGGVTTMMHASRAIHATTETIRATERVGEGVHALREAEHAVDVGKASKSAGKVTGGSFKAVDAAKGSDEVGHHIAQNAYNKTQGISRNEGPAVLMSKADHAKTRTFAGKGKAAMREDAELNGRQRMAKDVWDVKNNFGTKYNEGLKQAVRYGQQIYKK